MNYEQFMEIAIVFTIIVFLITVINFLLLFFILKISLIMNDNLAAIKQLLSDTKEVVVKVSKDVDNLHQRINEITGEVPTAEEWAEIKGLAQGLKDSIVAVDEKTEDELPAGE